MMISQGFSQNIVLDVNPFPWKFLSSHCCNGGGVLSCTKIMFFVISHSVTAGHLTSHIKLILFITVSDSLWLRVVCFPRSVLHHSCTCIVKPHTSKDDAVLVYSLTSDMPCCFLLTGKYYNMLLGQSMKCSTTGPGDVSRKYGRKGMNTEGCEVCHVKWHKINFHGLKIILL
jgi:hypothetical protein